jgi:uncharacterized integral membrane protein (TIGR00698 family)
MDLNVIGRVGFQSLLYTVLGLTLTLTLSHWVGKWLKSGSEISALIGVGTAICGGSAIAAVAPVIHARDESTTVSLATVFLLNAAALVLFPFLGHWSGLDQRQFGLFSALAIHDTSSVVGAAMQYGSEALTIATTVKLARALWIVPVTIGFAYARKRRQSAAETAGKAKRPWFILGFLGMAALVTWVPVLASAGQMIASLARIGLVFTLFLIGAGLTRATLKAVGIKPLVHGILLWVVVIAGTWGSIELGWIR